MLSENELQNFRETLQGFVSTENFPEESEMLLFLDKSIETLENEDPSYRPAAKDRKPGGLLDFSKSSLPVIAVPDLHGRADFLLKLLDKKIADDYKNVLEMLNLNKIIVVCVGDGVHAEARAYDRWLKSYEKWLGGEHTSQTMTEEMHENFSTMQIVCSLKNTFPRNFHFLKGNHENILNENGNGNFSFRKFCQEGQMCHDFILKQYGEAILHLINLWEKSLPLCIVFKNMVISHAEPAVELAKNEIINYHENEYVILGLTWTNNDEAETDSVRKTFRNLNPWARQKGVIWIGGHRPVPEKFLLRQDGKYLQLHNPNAMNFAYINVNDTFDEQKDILTLGD